jgi:hypothetical protein
MKMFCGFGSCFASLVLAHSKGYLIYHFCVITCAPIQFKQEGAVMFLLIKPGINGLTKSGKNANLRTVQTPPLLLERGFYYKKF